RARGHLRILHWSLAALFATLLASSIYLFLLAGPRPTLAPFQYLLMLSSIAPSALVGYWMFRFNFLQAAAQRAVALAVFGVAGGLACALVIQRIADRLEPVFPSAFTEALLVFLLLVLVEPVSRRVQSWLRRQVSSELANVEALGAELQERALAGSPEQVRAI